LTNTLPGMVVAPPGVANGPITGSELALLGADPATVSAMQAHLDDGSMSGYIRTWIRQPANGDAIVIQAFQFQESPDADAFIAAAENQLKTLTPVLGTVQSATGPVSYTMATATMGRVVYFAQGTDAFLISLRSPAADFTTDDLVSLVVHQGGRASGTTSGSSSGLGLLGTSFTAYDAGEVFSVVAGLVLIIGLITIWVQSRRKRGAATSRTGAVPTTVDHRPYPPAPIGPAEPGWLPNPGHMNEQLFWNGREWAGRRHWMAGRGWVVSVPPSPAAPAPAHAP
jgi:hypothetical protein